MGKGMGADEGVIERGIREIDLVLREGGGRCALLCDEVCRAALHLCRISRELYREGGILE